MKKLALGFLLVGVIMIYASLANASCVSNHAIQHPTGGVGNLAASPCPSCIPRFWCLSTGNANNQGTNTAWWQYYAPSTSWWYNGSWQNPGINGCCGMWDAVGGNSRAMMAVVEAYQNEGAATHFGTYEAEICERQTAGGTDFAFQRPANYDFREIPPFRVGTFTQGTPSGTSTLGLTGWSTPPAPAAGGPAQYWIYLQNATGGTNLTQSSICSGGASACPAAIQGYQIRAAFRGCVGGTCPNPVRPTSSLIAQWPTLAGGTAINVRVPTFPINGVTVANPAAQDATTNTYLWYATQLLYADGFSSNYVSRSNYGIRWYTNFGSEIDALTAKYSTPSDVRIDWKSVVEGNSFGYNVYRSFNPTGTFTKVNAKVIPTLGEGASYAYKDRVISPTPRKAYYKVGIVRDIASGKDDIQENIAVAVPR